MIRHPVLLIEHDPIVQVILIDILTHAGYDAHAAILEDDVRRLLVRYRLAVAVISGGNRGTFAAGWRMAALIAASDPTLPVVMLTTNYAVLQEVGQTERGRLFAAGLLKPFNLHELLATVARCRRSVAPAEQPRPHMRIFSREKRRCV